MSNIPSAKTIRNMVVLIFCLAVIAIVASPPKSRARLVSTKPDTLNRKAKHPFVPGDVLVRFRNERVAKQRAGTATLRSAAGRDIEARIERFDGSNLVEGLRLAKVAPEDTLSAVDALRRQPDVLYAEPNYILKADLTPNDPRFVANDLYGLSRIDAPTAWDTETGKSSVVVAVIDQGIDLNHQDLNANRWINSAPGSIPGFSGDVNGYNFIDNNGTVFSGDSTEDHATHVAGIAGAVGNNGIGVVGVNWTVRLMSLRFLDEAGIGATSDAVRAVGYAKSMRDLFITSGGTQGANVRVLNNSYGGGAFSQTFVDAVNAINGSGILFVAAAGNVDVGSSEPDNDVIPHYPASIIAPNVIAVANTTPGDTLFTESHFGANSVHLGAPGTSIWSTTPNNNYEPFSGTSMASPHVAGAAALLWAENPNLTVKQVKDLLLLNGDVLTPLVGKTITGRRLNVGKSMQALNVPDTTAPGAVTNLQVNGQTGRNLNIRWTASGDDGSAGTAALYQLTFTDARTGEVLPLKSVVPAASGAIQNTDIKLPFRHTRGTVNVRGFDNVGNESPVASLPIQVPFAAGDPYATTLTTVAGLTTGGSRLFGGPGDDDKYNDFILPFAFPFFGSNRTTVTISTNGNLFFSTPPERCSPEPCDGDADDVPSLISDLERHQMISGLWDDINLAGSGPNTRADAGVYVVQPNSNQIIFRWQGVPCTFGGPPNEPPTCQGGNPVNFEVELNSDGTIKSRYGTGNNGGAGVPGLFPVVGISGGEPDAYVIPSHTSEFDPLSLNNAVEVVYIPRSLINPLEHNYFFASQHYRDFLGRDPDNDGLAYWANEINVCNTAPDPAFCKNARRIGVSAAFFVELEFQRTGSFVYRLYKGGLTRRPTFTEFNTDRVQVVEGPNLEATKDALALAFVQRTEFVNKFDTQNSAAAFVDALIAAILADTQVNLSGIRQQLIDRYGQGANQNQSRSFALRMAIDNTAFQNAEFNRAFVLMQYFGYLHRDPDQAGYDFWLGIVNNQALNNYRAMVCAFVTSAEYQQNFSDLVPRNNQMCADNLINP